MKIRNFNKSNEHTSILTNSSVHFDIVEYIPQYTHEYEIFPYTYNSVISLNGNIIDKQSFQNEGRKYKVIYNGNTTIVILEDGSKGIARRNPLDAYDKFKGYAIAFKRAQINKLKNELKQLTK